MSLQVNQGRHTISGQSDLRGFNMDSLPRPDTAVEDRVFSRQGIWYCVVKGKVFGAWPDRGAALAGIQTEMRRAARHRHPSNPPEIALD